MPSCNDVISSVPPFLSNAFNATFLRLFDERDEPITGSEADMAGPWSVEPIPGRGYGLFREGESLARGFRPTITFADRWLALLAAAVLPGTGRDSLLSLAGDPDPGGDGYAVLLDDGTVVGHAGQFEETLIERINAAVDTIRHPASIAYLLEAAGPLAVLRSGAIFAQRIAAARAAEEKSVP
jgi:hypothetical protein